MAEGIVSSVDMPLDAIVTSNKNAQRAKLRRGRGRVGGNRRNFNTRSRGMNQGNTQRSYVGKRGGGRRRRRQLPEIWDKGSLLEKGNAVLSNATKDVVISSNRLLISNLNFGVVDNDIKELFSTCGKLKKALINYDNSGHSNGTAEVVYFDKASAQKAYHSFNGVCLDKRPLKIQFLDAPDASKTTISRLSLPGGSDFAFKRFPMRRKPTFGGKFNNNRSRGKGGLRRGGRKFRTRSTKSNETLDQEMIAYQNNDVDMN